MPKLAHEGLAETHDLTRRLAAGREVGTTLGATHRQRGERVFEGLLESQELKDALVDGSVETKTTLVRANGVVVLNAVTIVGLHVAFVVDPVHAELDDTVGNAQTLNEVLTVKLGVLVVLILDGAQHLTNGLDVLGLARIDLLQSFYYFRCFHNVLYWLLL